MPRIDELYAYITEDTGPEDEGIPAALELRTGMWMPLVGADLDRINSLRGEAEATARERGIPVRLVRFSVRTDLEVIQP